MRRIASYMLLALLLLSLFVLPFKIQPVAASGTIYIRADGSIDPPAANIVSYDNITYVFTSNINDSIVVERSSITLDGNGFTLQGSGSGNGIFLDSVNHVTLSEVIIRNYYIGIYVSSSSDNMIIGNTIFKCSPWGVRIVRSSRNTISHNNITSNIYQGYPDPTGGGIEIRSDLGGNSENNRITENTIKGNRASGIQLVESRFNEICGNNITDNHSWGVRLLHSSRNRVYGNFMKNQSGCVGFYVSLDNSVYDNIMIGSNAAVSITESSRYNMVFANQIRNNTYGVGISNPYLGGTLSNMVFGNQIEANEYGVYGTGGVSNRIWHNNFVDNTEQAALYGGIDLQWDDGYPSGGNYWSNYNGTDLFSGPYQNLTGSDGIGDTAYVIIEEQDNYPLMGPRSTVSPWADDDGDGTLNYLDVPGLNTSTSRWSDRILGFEWSLAWTRSEGVINCSLLSAIYNSWGINTLEIQKHMDFAVLDLGGFGQALTWLRSNVPFLITQDFMDSLMEYLCSDGHFRLLLFAHHEIDIDEAFNYLLRIQKLATSPDLQAFLTGFSYFCNSFDVEIYRLEGVDSVQAYLQFDWTYIARAVEALKLGFGDLGGLVGAIKDVAEIALLMIEAAAFPELFLGFALKVLVKTFKLVLDLVAFVQVSIHEATLDWVKTILVSIDPPGEKLVLQLRDPGSGALVLGYNSTSGIDIGAFPYGIYVSEDDSALMILARDYVNYNLTVTCNSTGSSLPYMMIVWDWGRNKTVTMGGFLESEQETSSSIRVEGDVLVMSYLQVQANFSTLTPNVGEQVGVNITVTDNMGSAVDGVTVALYLNDERTFAQDLGGGRYQTQLNTSGMLGFYNVTIYTVNPPSGFLQGMVTYPFEVGLHDVAVSRIDLMKSSVGQGFQAVMNLTVLNPGCYVEVFNVTVFANATSVTSQAVTLSGKNSTVLTLAWNTTGFAMGSYTISVVADTVPDETDTADNTCIDGWIFVTIPGDVNSDKKVDMRDISIQGRAFGSTVTSPNWNAHADINNDCKIDMRDIGVAARNFGQSW